MKTKRDVRQNSQLTTDSQKRLVAYTTAAGLGALFTGYSVEGQVTQSTAFASYPATLLSATGTNTVDIPFDVDGDGNNDFHFIMFGQGNIPNHSQVADLVGLTNSVGTTNLVLNSAATSYLMAWLGGSTINASTGVPPTYKPRLAISYAYGLLLDNKFPVNGAVGFSFVGGDSQTHFGYMHVRANTATNNLGEFLITSVTVQDLYYNATANTDITVPVSVVVTNIAVGAGNAITINFNSNDNAPASAFTLQTSPTLGPSANWTADPNAVITLLTAANPRGGKPLAYYQAATTGSGGPSQFFRISH
jgi:hypothetical protein